MKKKILFLSVLLITISSILCLSGCSCLLSLPAVVDQNTYEGSISELNLDSLPTGREVVVYLADGNRLRGEYIGLDSLRVEKPPEAEEIKAPFQTAIAVKDTLGENLIPVDEVEQIEVKAKTMKLERAFSLGIVIDMALVVITGGILMILMNIANK